jgi:hypothetical protein
MHNMKLNYVVRTKACPSSSLEKKVVKDCVEQAKRGETILMHKLANMYIKSAEESTPVQTRSVQMGLIRTPAEHIKSM